ncbi:MAG: RIP metalloprotease RseP [Alphaproteobacteria bacterium]
MAADMSQMLFISWLYIYATFLTMLVFLPVLGAVIIVHELGHFLVARYFGVAVDKFSIGFGPEIWGRYDRYGTRWRVAWIPLGGYVMFKGDSNAASFPTEESISQLSEEEKRGNYHAKPLAQRAAVSAAGPIANFLLAIVIFTFWFMFVGKAIIEPRVEKVVPNSAAAEAGLKPGDLITQINGYKIRSFDDIQHMVMFGDGSTLKVAVDRGGQTVEMKVAPRLVEIKDPDGNLMKIRQLGIMRPTDSKRTYQRFYPLGAFSESLSETYRWLKQPVIVIRKLIASEISPEQIGGPVGIARMSYQIASVDVINLFFWTAVISIQIGFMNLLPVPVLDGGHLLFYGVEAIRGRRMSERAMEISFRIGLTLVIMLMLFATRNDLVHLFRKLG